VIVIVIVVVFVFVDRLLDIDLDPREGAVPSALFVFFCTPDPGLKSRL